MPLDIILQTRCLIDLPLVATIVNERTDVASCRVLLHNRQQINLNIVMQNNLLFIIINDTPYVHR